MNEHTDIPRPEFDPEVETHESTSPLDVWTIEKEKLQAAVEEQKHKYLSALAELENTRKRLQKERIEMTRFAVEEVIADFLMPMDQMEKALGFTSQMSTETQNWALGFNMILTQFKGVLNDHGITSFGSKGDHFDPHLHEAVEVLETLDSKEDTIVEVFSKGYKSSDRTICPARVKVAKAPKLAQDEPENN